MIVPDQIDELRRELADTYAIERLVGRGGMAMVYLAHDLKLNRRVALKVLRPELTVAVGIERFNREVRFAAGLQHPHILPVYDSGSAGNMLFYVMPFVEGESLQDRLEREGKLPVEDAIHIARDISGGLTYAHSKGVVHRDVKPANIMLSGNQAVITDFGIAKAVSDIDGDQLTHTGIAVGTPTYMSPEQAAGGADVDGRSDIYSLGCVLFEMLTGEPPYQGSTTRATIAQRFVGPVPSVRRTRSEVPVTVERAVAKAMSKLPSDRFPTGQEFAKALDGTVSVESPTSRFKQTVVATVAFAGLALVVGSLWIKGQSGGGQVSPGTDIIAVMPFNAAGTGVEVLGEGMVDLLSTNLDGVGGIRTIDPRVVLHRWRQEGGGGPLTLEEALEVGRNVNAGAILRGSVVAAGPEVRITADLYSTSGEHLARISADGPADSVLALVDQVSIQLVREVWRSQDPLPDLRVSALTTTSLDALRSFLRGEQLYRRSLWDSATAAFNRSIEEDSTFALAYLRLAHVYGWTEGHGSEAASRFIGLAERNANKLPARERLLVVAHRLTEDGNLAAIDSLRVYVARYPDDAEGWYELGDAQYHARYALALSEAELLQPFERALSLDPTLTPSLIHPAEIALVISDSARFESYVAQMEAGADPDLAAPFRDMGLVLWDSSAAGDSAGARIATERTRRREWLDLMINAYFTSPGVDLGRVMAVMDSAIAVTPVDDSDGLLLLAMKARLLTGLGRLAGASRLVDSIYQVNPPIAVFASLYPSIAGYADISFAVPALRVLSAIPRNNPLAGYLRSLYMASTGDLPNARVEGERQLDILSDSVADPMSGLFAELLGWITVLEGDTIGGLTAMRNGLADVGFAPGASSFAGPLNFELGTLLVQRDDSRAEGLDRLRYGVGEDREYRALAYLTLGQALEEDGNATEAIEAYSHFIRLWDGADPQLESLVQSARNAVSRLIGEPVIENN
ncbi:MAG: protein kinase [Gemmatimonadetes bacterium]|nr:protein kinase [Gemmatimonadota bacterium]